MKLVITTLFLFLSAAIFAQEKPQVNIYSSALNIGETLVFGDRSLRFKNVVSDSRCPRDVTCIWAGEAVITVEVFENGNYIEEKILTVASSNIPLEFSAENIIYNITGLVLSPYPSVKDQNLPKEYKLYMKVSETIEL